LYSAKTRFQLEGLHAANLTEEERNLLIQYGLDPDEINYEGTELEEKVTVTDMLRRQWQEIMDVVYKDCSGQYPGKTIVFAMTQKHALRLEEAFNQVFPQFPGMAHVITYKSNYRDTYLKAFKKEDQPRIAISVDMLDTGVDIPEVTNLVFMKPVGSPIKLHQMIGRGTRIQAACRKLELLPNYEKKEFLIIDFWDNNFSRDAKEAPDNATPVMVRVFNTRLNLLETYLDDQKNPECQGVINDLRGMITRIPTASLLVKHSMPEIEDVWKDAFWNYLLLSSIKRLREKVGPHLRYAADVDVAAETFISKLERLKLALRTGKNTKEIAQSIAEDIMKLSENILDESQISLRRKCIPPTLESSSFDELNEIRDGLAREMKNKSTREDPLVIDYLRDFIAVRGYILLTKRGEQMYVEEYRRLVEKRILDLVANHPAINAIQRGETVTDEQLLELERTLHKELGDGDLEVTPDNIRKAFGGLKVESFLAFVRQVLDLAALPDYQDVVQRQFEEFIIRYQYNADQIRFLRAVQSVFLEKRKLVAADLYEPPLTNFGSDAVDKWFNQKEVADIVNLTDHLTI
jgi:type I restriction enzyme R subunit